MAASQISTRFLNPPTMPQPFGYSHVAEARGGRTIYISGQVAMDSAGNVVGLDDLQTQTTQVFKNLDAALADSGRKRTGTRREPPSGMRKGREETLSSRIGSSASTSFPGAGAHRPHTFSFSRRCSSVTFSVSLKRTKRRSGVT